MCVFVANFTAVRYKFSIHFLVISSSESPLVEFIRWGLENIVYILSRSLIMHDTRSGVWTDLIFYFIHDLISIDRWCLLATDGDEVETTGDGLYVDGRFRSL